MQIQHFDENGQDIPDPFASEYGNATVQSLNITGLNVQRVEIEVDVSPGLPCFIIVGLPDAAVAEARDRVRTAIKNSGFRFPRTRVTVNLAPGHIRKVGSLFDLPIALGVLIASGQLKPVAEARDWYAIGELSLHGAVRAVRGALPLVHYGLSKHGAVRMIVPAANADELSLYASNPAIAAAAALREVAAAFEGTGELHSIGSAQTQTGTASKPAVTTSEPTMTTASARQAHTVLMEDIAGQEHAKRALVIAAAGGHNLLLNGIPGVGKSMLAQALPSILPQLTTEEILETRMIHSVAGIDCAHSTAHGRPFRAPHHSASTVSIAGGGSTMRPGEISLAHNGVLFLDELPEFKRSVIETLRQPLENGVITISRAHGSVTYPAKCIFVAAMNPCPCGYAPTGSGGIAARPAEKECTCTAYMIQRYQQKLSGPLLDRIDMKVHAQYVSPEHIRKHAHDTEQNTEAHTETSAHIQKTVQHAYAMQLERQECANAYLSAKQIRMHVSLAPDDEQILNSAMRRGLSMRGYIKTLRVARTIADIEQRAQVGSSDIAEALSYTL